LNGRECTRELSVSETLIETIHLVTASHINPLGILHGGVGLRWMITTGSLAAMRVARGPALIVHLDNVFFLNPVRLGYNAVISGWVDYVGRSSLEITVIMEEEDPASGNRRLTTASHMTFVAVDENIKPRKVPTCLKPASPFEEELMRRAIERRKSRGPRLSPLDISPPQPLIPEHSLTSYKLVNPEDTLTLNVMHGGRLLYLMDELAGITAMKYAKGVMVTAAIDATDFVHPIWVGDILEIHTALTFVGRTSLEITVKSITTNPWTGEKRHTTTSYFTLVHLGKEMKPAPVPPFKPEHPWQEELYKRALKRRKNREKILNYFKQSIELVKPPRRIH
jgi:acyl-CoA hydrolase